MIRAHLPKPTANVLPTGECWKALPRREEPGGGPGRAGGPGARSEQTHTEGGSVRKESTRLPGTAWHSARDTQGHLQTILEPTRARRGKPRAEPQQASCTRPPPARRVLGKTLFPGTTASHLEGTLTGRVPDFTEETTQLN